MTATTGFRNGRVCSSSTTSLRSPTCSPWPSRRRAGGPALSKSRILDHVWSSSFDGGGNLVEVCISSLRRKIDKGRAPVIHTVRGLGYAIRPAEDGR